MSFVLLRLFLKTFFLRSMKHTRKQSKKQSKRQRGSISRPAARHAPYKAPKRSSAYHMAEGVFFGTRSGYGFVRVEGEEEDIFIPAHLTGGAIDQDKVLIRYRNQYGGRSRTEGEVVRITQAGREHVIGTLMEETVFLPGRRSKSYVRYTIIPDDPHLSMPLYVKELGDAKTGDKVEVTLGKRYPGQTEIWCYLTRTFGSAFGREANYNAILADLAIPTAFSSEALREAEEAAAQPLSDDGRVRRTGEIIFTIDGADAKDLDDAISLTCRRDGSYLLGVHIADVSHYVLRGSQLEKEAFERGTSVYFTDKVVPMLPEALSNGACSLNPNEDKYALSAMVALSADGAITGTTITRSIIRSRVRGVYSEVNDLFENGKASAFYEKYREVYPTLTRMRRLYRILAERAKARGAMELERPEAKILLDENGDPIEIVARERGDAEKLIEQFMLAANEGVATLMQEKNLPCVWRVHEKPTEDKISDFLTFAHNLGFDVSGVNRYDPTPLALSALLEQAKAHGNHSAVSYTLLRAMAKAKYSHIPHAHFGLGIEKYCHFTSPIRRLSDLASHRIIKATLLDGLDGRAYQSYAGRAADAATETELRALAAERRIEALYKTIYLAKHKGELFEATISSVTSFGAFAELTNTCEGMLPLAELPGGIWTYDEGTCSLRCGRDRLTLGDRVEIRVEEADLARGKVRFSLSRIIPRTPL